MNSPFAQPPRDPREQLLRYLDGSLPSDEVARLNATLKSDAALRRDLAELLLQQVQLGELGHAAQASASATSTLVPLPAIDGAAPAAAERPSLAQPMASWRRHGLPLLALAACLAVLLGVSIWFFGPTMGEPGVAEVHGSDVSVERGTEMIPASSGMRLQPADVLRTGTNATAMIIFGPEKTRVELRPGAELKLVSLARGKQFDLRQGKIEANVARQRLLKPMLVRTPQAEARVLGTKFTLAATTNATRLEVNEGTVKLTRTSDGAAVKVYGGYYATASDGAELVALPFTGRISREYWTLIRGLEVGDLTTHTNYPDKPSGRDFINSLEEPTNLSGGYGTRTRGYLYPPKTGQYRFWIAADDSAQLYLSLDNSPDQKDMIASLYFRCKPHEWTKYPWQQSSLIKLKAGRGYYIEVLHSKNSGAGHLAVAWQTPGRKREIIPGAYLAPFETDR